MLKKHAEMQKCEFKLMNHEFLQKNIIKNLKILTIIQIWRLSKFKKN